MIYKNVGVVDIDLATVGNLADMRAFMDEVIVLDVQWQPYRQVVVYTIYSSALPEVSKTEVIPEYTAVMHRYENGDVKLLRFVSTKDGREYQVTPEVDSIKPVDDMEVLCEFCRMPIDLKEIHHTHSGQIDSVPFTYRWHKLCYTLDDTDTL
jgi:hypothetical protein